MAAQTILVTGGAGFIGSHTCVELLAAGYEVVVVDNFCNSKPESLRRVEELAGRKLAAFYEADVRDKVKMAEVLAAHAVCCVIHFAALKAVGESVSMPLRYYENNVSGTIALAQVMAEAGVFNLVFSSSATVYGNAKTMPISEATPTESPTNPYGQSKLMMEVILRDIARADARWNIALLRYFNPVGAHASGRIGEDPNGIPNNLMPFVAQVAVGRRAQLSVYGGDYPTKDGTGVRDFIHVVDLAKGHVCAVRRLARPTGVLIVNLGTGHGVSVLEVVRAFEKASGRPVPYAIVDRRVGDVAECYADASFAASELGWRAELGLDRMCEDAWRWQSQNPNGFDAPA